MFATSQARRNENYEKEIMETKLWKVSRKGNHGKEIVERKSWKGNYGKGMWTTSINEIQLAHYWTEEFYRGLHGHNGCSLSPQWHKNKPQTLQHSTLDSHRKVSTSAQHKVQCNCNT